VPAHHADVLTVVETAYRQYFEAEPNRASISFVGVDTIEVLRYAEGDLQHYLSLGLSRYPMTDPAAVVIDDAVAPRAELLISAIGRPDELWRQLAVLAAAPAVEGAVYAPGNRVDLGQPICPGSRCTGGILIAGPIPPIVVAGISDVTVLQLLPATANELAWARVHGSSELQARWTASRTDLTDLSRDSTNLSSDSTNAS
jgi:hypothetical protein